MSISNEKPHKKVLVCGGRSFGCTTSAAARGEINLVALAKAESERALLSDVLNKLQATVEILCIIEGDAPGADRLAGNWARNNCIPSFKHPADWKKLGKAAGPIRNALMIDIHQPDLVVAFPGSKGTADMVSKAKDAGIEVMEVPITLMGKSSLPC